MTGCVLIVDPVPAMRALLRTKLEAAYFETALASGFDDVFQVAENAHPDVVLISSALGARAACQLCRALKSTPALSLLPVLVTAHPGASYLAEAFAAGADDVIAHPVSDALLQTRLRKLVRGKLALDVLRLRDDAARALGYDPSGSNRMPPMLAGRAVVHLFPASLSDGADWTRDLAKAGFRAKAFCGEIAGTQPDMAEAAACVIGHAPEEGFDGLKALAGLRARPELRQTPVIMVLPGKPPAPLASLALEMGASDFMGIAPVEGELAGRVQAQLRLRRQSERLQQALREGVRLSLI
ncbi:MAG: response regulator, partial [Pseudomonadota bacterium]